MKLIKLTLNSCYQPPGDYDELLKLIEEDDEIEAGKEYSIMDADTESVSISEPPPEDDNDSDFPADTDSTGWDTPTLTSNQRTSTSSTISDDSPRPPAPHNSPLMESDSDTDLNFTTLSRALRNIATDLDVYNRIHPIGPPRVPRRSTRTTKQTQIYQAGGIPARRRPTSQ